MNDPIRIKLHARLDRELNQALEMWGKSYLDVPALFDAVLSAAARKKLAVDVLPLEESAQNDRP